MEMRLGVFCIFLCLLLFGELASWKADAETLDDIGERRFRALLLKHKRSPIFEWDPKADEEIKYIFEQLDKNKDGRIVRDEFVNGFESAVFSGEKCGYKGLTRRASTKLYSPPPPKLEKTTTTKGSSSRPEITYNFEPEPEVLDQLPCQEDVLNLYSHLQGSGVPQVLNQFENIIGNICKELKDQKEQNERLQFVYQKEKEQYSQHLKNVETELDQQVSEAEERARRIERDKLEKEKEEMRDRLECEIGDLQQNIKRLHKMETVLAGNRDKAQKANDMKQQIQKGSSPISPSSSVSHSRQESVSSLSSHGRRHTPTPKRPQHLQVAGGPSSALKDSVETDDDIDSGLARGSDTTGSADDTHATLDMDLVQLQTPRQTMDNDSELSGLEEYDLRHQNVSLLREEFSGQRQGSLEAKQRISSISSAGTLRSGDQQIYLDLQKVQKPREPAKELFINYDICS